MRLILVVLVASTVTAVPAAAQDPFGWRTAGAAYLDPTSFFSLHGYVDAVFAGGSPEWTASDPTQLPAPGQLLVPNTNRASFQYDAAFFISSEISPETSIMFETHLVSDPSGTGAAGPGGVTMAITEATATWRVVPRHLEVSGGIFWLPFGTVNRDWLGAQNMFTLVPRASGPIPAHFNERGLRINGAAAFSDDAGFNYVAAVGNGVQSFAISGQRSADPDQNKTVTGRVGIFPGLGSDLEVGYSMAHGTLREAEDQTRGLNDPLRYASEFVAYGADLNLHRGPWTVRGYAIQSTETLTGAPSLRRRGAMAEVEYAIAVESTRPSLVAVAPKARIDWAETDRLTAAGAGTARSRGTVYSVGLRVNPASAFHVNLEYHLQREATGPTLDNDRFVARITGQF